MYPRLALNSPVAKKDLELLILLHPPLKCCDLQVHATVPPHLASEILLNFSIKQEVQADPRITLHKR